MCQQGITKVNVLQGVSNSTENREHLIPDVVQTSIINKFHEFVRCGPEYICMCCDQLWYKSSVKKCNVSSYNKWDENMVKICITGRRSADDTEWICNTCLSDLQVAKRASSTFETVADNGCSTRLDNTEIDDWCEDEECPPGVTDTLLQQPDISQYCDEIISFAPAEGNKPLGLFMDKDSEFLSFPTIFCGKRRPTNSERKVPVSYSTVAKWELRCQDRRAAQSVPNIFYKLKKLQIKRIRFTACICLQKCKIKGKTFTAGELRTEDYVKKLIHLDKGFRVLKI